MCPIYLPHIEFFGKLLENSGFPDGEDTILARLVYTVKSKGGKLEQKEEIIAVLKDWIKDADYAGGVIKHAINLGNTDDFVPVPPGRSIIVHT